MAKGRLKRSGARSMVLGLANQSTRLDCQVLKRQQTSPIFLIAWSVFLGQLSHCDLIWLPQLPRFFLYEEYGAKYESMLQGMGSLSKTLPTWSAYERGIESLVNSLLPHGGGTLSSKKGLTFEDLLIKVCSGSGTFNKQCD